MERLHNLVKVNKLAEEEQHIADKMLMDMEREIVRRQQVLTARLALRTAKVCVYVCMRIHVHVLMDMEREIV
jgi:hypothetical protein